MELFGDPGELADGGVGEGCRDGFGAVGLEFQVAAFGLPGLALEIDDREFVVGEVVGDGELVAG
ncbi:hypothetical protein [Kribbella qitaiheensis]|uniref:hypothetical protein n=1 Tax=Kribbella qitaiheensis TaxID=1544730 RepID=UPI0031B5DFF6